MKNIFYTYYKPINDVMHSGNIFSCYSHYIKDKDKIQCINTWAFLNRKNLNESNISFNDKDIVNINEPCFLIVYEVRNSGHTLASILNQIKYYIDNKYNYKIVIPNELLSMSKYIYSIISLLINMNNVIILNSSKIYYFDELIFQHSNYFTNHNRINKKFNDLNNELTIKSYKDDPYYVNYGNYFLNASHTILDNLLLNQIKKSLVDDVNIKTYDNICLIKTNSNVLNASNHINKMYSIERSFNESYSEYFIKNDYHIINPSDYNIKELYIILNNAKNIVVSWGCNSYMNKMIINNNNINYFVLIHNGYMHELQFFNIYEMVPPSKNVIMVCNLISELNETNYKVLDNAMHSI